MLDEVRAEFSHACSTLRDVRPEWVYMLIARVHDQLAALRAFIMSVKPPEVIAPRNCDTPSLRFFTDCAAKYPKSASARIATWAVVQDTTFSEDQIRSAADFLFLTPPKFRKFHVTALGIVPGEQAVARAEFCAIVHAAWQVSMCEPIPRTEFVTDASYACHVIKIVESGSFQHVLHKFSKTVKGLVLRPFCCDKSQESQSF